MPSLKLKTLADLRNHGRDPFAIFRVDEALAIDGAWLGRVMDGAPLAFWDDEDEDGDGVPDDEMAPYTIEEGGLAVYDIEGPLVQRGWMCWPGYDSIGRDIDQALGDSRVKTLLLRVNSPGGMAAGCFEGSRQIRDSIERSGKRCVAFADEMAFSAAYCIAAVADEIVVPEPGGVGSVGVIASMQSVAKALAAAGVDVRVFTSGAEKGDGHPALPITPGAVERTQARVDALADIFRRWVAERRGMTPEAVRGLEAGVRYGRDAVSSGLADRVMSLPALRTELRARAASPSPAPGPGARGPTRSPAAGATPAAPTTRKSTMNADQLAALAAATGETDPDKIVAAVGTMKAVAAGAGRLSAAVAEATGKTAIDEQVGAVAAMGAKAVAHDAAVARAEKAEKGAREVELEQLLREGLTAGKLTPAQCAKAEEGRPAGWARRQSAETLRTFLADAPRVVPGGEHQPPTDAPEAQLAPDLAAIAAKGWDALSDREKHRLYTANRPLALRLKAAASRALGE